VLWLGLCSIGVQFIQLLTVKRFHFKKKTHSPNHRLVRGSHVAPVGVDHDKGLASVLLRVKSAPQRPEVQAGDERGAGALVHQADLQEVGGSHGHDVHPVDRGRVPEPDLVPEARAQVQVEDGRRAQAVVVRVVEGGADEVLVPGDQGGEGVAVPNAGREGADGVVALREGRADVAGGDVAVLAGGDEAAVGDVEYGGGEVLVRGVLRDAAVDAYETCWKGKCVVGQSEKKLASWCRVWRMESTSAIWLAAAGAVLQQDGEEENSSTQLHAFCPNFVVSTELKGRPCACVCERERVYIRTTVHVRTYLCMRSLLRRNCGQESQRPIRN
jgi:hypothetical protein